MNIAEERKGLIELGPERLAEDILNMRLNDFVGHYADYDDGDDDQRGHGKRIPYIGWYWRSVRFADVDPYIPIGDCGEFIGFMENNKWGYPQRALTAEETEQVLAIVTEAYRLNQEGGIVSEIIDNATGKLEELWDLMQTFVIERGGFWIFGPQGRVAHASDQQEADTMIVALQEAAPGFVYRKEPV